CSIPFSSRFKFGKLPTTSRSCALSYGRLAPHKTRVRRREKNGISPIFSYNSKDAITLCYHLSTSPDTIHCPLAPRTPTLILYGAGVEDAGTRASVATNTWDVAATILDVAGVTPPAGHPLMGTSLLALDRDDRERIVISHLYDEERRWVAAITSGHKFIHY